MIQIIKSKDRHFNDFGWLQTHWLFSFSNYHDPENISHGRLRVFNDDVVKAQKRFDTHPHEKMEIVSIVLDGEMVHEDTMGNTTTIRKNESSLEIVAADSSEFILVDVPAKTI